MATEVIMVFEQQDTGGGSPLLPVEPCSGESADACPDDDEIVTLGTAMDFTGMLPKRPVAESVEGLKGTRVTAS